MSDTVETILVRRKQTGDECLINATDFDPEQHEKVVEQNETSTSNESSNESSEPASNASSDNGTNETRRRGGRS